MWQLSLKLVFWQGKAANCLYSCDCALLILFSSYINVPVYAENFAFKYLENNISVYWRGQPFPASSLRQPGVE